jgi:hypothetical protein
MSDAAFVKLAERDDEFMDTAKKDFGAGLRILVEQVERMRDAGCFTQENVEQVQALMGSLRGTLGIVARLNK